MKNVLFLLSLSVMTLYGCYPSRISGLTPPADNTYFVTSFLATPTSKNDSKVSFALKRTLLTTAKDVTFTVVYRLPETDRIVNIERYIRFGVGEYSKNIELNVPMGVKIDLILYERDANSTYHQKDVGGSKIFRLN